HPNRHTLSEFRAPGWLVDLESEALEAADSIVTPHSEIARLFGARARRIPWKMPKSLQAKSGGAIVFPCPTAARQGAYEVRPRPGQGPMKCGMRRSRSTWTLSFWAASSKGMDFGKGFELGVSRKCRINSTMPRLWFSPPWWRTVREFSLPRPLPACR